MAFLSLENLAGFLAFPIPSLLQRPVEFHGPGTRTIVYTGAAVPAFLRMQNDRALSLFRIGDEDVHGAMLDTDVASVAYFRIEDCGSARRGHIWSGINFHGILPLSGNGMSE